MQLDSQREAYSELESLLDLRLEEHEAQETQFTAEHEEEVRALRQQKQLLMEKLDESKEHLENILESQDEEVSYTLCGHQRHVCGFTYYFCLFWLAYAHWYVK